VFEPLCSTITAECQPQTPTNYFGFTIAGRDAMRRSTVPPADSATRAVAQEADTTRCSAPGAAPSATSMKHRAMCMPTAPPCKKFDTAGAVGQPPYARGRIFAGSLIGQQALEALGAVVSPPQPVLMVQAVGEIGHVERPLFQTHDLVPQLLEPGHVPHSPF
jgi:hypothetical protein